MLKELSFCLFIDGDETGKERDRERERERETQRSGTQNRLSGA
jgi:hypothetical protein